MSLVFGLQCPQRFQLDHHSILHNQVGAVDADSAPPEKDGQLLLRTTLRPRSSSSSQRARSQTDSTSPVPSVLCVVGSRRWTKYNGALYLILMKSDSKTAFDTIFEIAEDQHGYFTTKQAADAGVDPRAIIMMAGRGSVERLHRGVYRVRRFPESRYGQYMEATMWPQGATGVVSHDSALLLFEMSDVNPDTVQITVPRHFRIRRSIPQFLTVHHDDLHAGEVTREENVPVTTPIRTIEDCVRSHMSRTLLVQAVSDGVMHGRLTRKDANRLKRRISRSFGPVSNR